MSKPKNCSTCAHRRATIGEEFSKCRRTGNYCYNEMKFPGLCGGKDLPLYEEKVTFFDKIKGIFK